MALSSDFWAYMPVRRIDEPFGISRRSILPGGFSSSREVRQRSLASLEDYERVLLSAQLRGLHDKTQVFPLDSECNVRTRLSHSYETASIASDILTQLLAGEEGAAVEADVPYEQLRYSLMAACLLHDVGNPPFGHFGEQVIRSWFSQNQGLCGRVSPECYRDLRNFEGNAGSLRIALGGAELFDGVRLNLSATTIAALVKYPWASDGRAEGEHESDGKFNIYQSDVARLGQLMARVRQSDACLGACFVDEGERHPLSHMLEAADDIAYMTADIEDSFNKGLVSVSSILDAYESLFADKDDAGEGSASRQARLWFSLLAYMAGSKTDRARMPQDVDAALYCTPAKVRDVGYFEGVTGAVAGGLDNGGRLRTFLEAARFVGPEADDWTLHQLQGTYLSQWLALVREWLIFCASTRLRMEFAQDEKALEDAACRSDRLQRVLRTVMRRYVYESPANMKVNLAAESALKGLLDKFVPAVVRVKNPVDLYDEANVVDGRGPSLIESSLVKMIPLRYRMDYFAREREATVAGRPWSAEPGDRACYERIMMLLDFIGGLTDGRAMELYQQIC